MSKMILVLYTEGGKPKLFTGTQAVWDALLGAAPQGSITLKMQTTLGKLDNHGGNSISVELRTWAGEGFAVHVPIGKDDPFYSAKFISSVLAWGAYYPRQERLRLTFNSGRQYDYAPVPLSQWETVAAMAAGAGSIGKWYNANIKGQFDCLFIADGVDAGDVPRYSPPQTQPVSGDGGALPEEIPTLRPHSGAFNDLAGTSERHDDTHSAPVAGTQTQTDHRTSIHIPTGTEFDDRLAQMRVSLKNASLLLEMQSAFKAVCKTLRDLTSSKA